jgi:hypothetical protein
MMPVSLSPGARLGPYQNLAKLGEGGPPSLAREGWASFGEARRSPAFRGAL